MRRLSPHPRPISPIGPISPIRPTGPIALALLLTLSAPQSALAAHRALLIGINDYTSAPRTSRLADRDWADLRGSVNDLRTMQELLVLLYGFHPRDIVTLTDQGATRGAIVSALEEHLVKPARKDDVVFFYYAGHGSQRPNSRSDERDRMDETLVPADSLSGVDDIRDKELRPLFNRILDQGARLTILLDNCHSGSGARGPGDARVRSLRADPRDVADRTDYGPRPEDRGALVLAAAQDTDDALELRDPEKKFRGAFSWAWVRAMRDATPDESAGETFLRARARLRWERPGQEPVLAGETAQRYPFLGGRTDRPPTRSGELDARFAVPVERIRKDGAVVLLAGWANGVEPGTELQLATDRRIRLTVTEMLGLGRSIARLPAGRATPQAIQSGALLEVTGWAAPPARALRVWMPRLAADGKRDVHAIARRFADAARERRLRWITDPAADSAAYTVRPMNEGWELLGPGASRQVLGDDNAVAAIRKLPPRSSLFVQLPAPAKLVDRIAIGPGTDRDGFELTQAADEADYLLAGRFNGKRVEYAWLRPSAHQSVRHREVLPLRSDWIAGDAALLRDAVLRLRRIHGWLHLESPPEARSPYRLVLRREGGETVRDGKLRGEQIYEPVLTAARPLSEDRKRFFYIFTIDSHGKSLLVFPAGGTGSVENRFPLTGSPTREIPLPEGKIKIEPPYGTDMYYLLSTDEALPNPWILEWDGVRTRSAQAPTALEQLLLLTGAPTRGAMVTTPRNWSLERVVFESVP